MRKFLAALAVLALSSSATFAGTGYGTLIKETLPGPTVPLCQSAKAVPLTGNTSQTVLATCTVNKKALGKNGRITVSVRFSHTNSGNNKTMKVFLNGVGGTAYLNQVDTATGVFMTSVEIANRGLSNSQVGIAANAAAFTTSTVDFAAASVPIVITGQLASAGENITLEQYSVTMVPQP